ncbi:GAF domain-containing protein [Stagnihabitans tardus]|uniref:GAF domain-containing protein n=1 Tax=Stagnihabitans tardus TaxID=2699202 RepID=A0AAE5BW87_9RHOB|nr:GAF domain-containing protein [Stagnihabitans tardus]NBZ89766.1 GAF domain-containing protein [Stagnihabitans tardus]
MARTTHAEKVSEALTRGEAARSALVASWSRSARLHGLDPQRRGDERLTDGEFRMARDRSGPLLSLARPAIERLFQTVGGLGACVILSDAEGIALDRCGAPCDDPDFAGWGLWTGTRWTEAAQGTNAIGTCLVEARPVTIHRDQHFLTRNTGLSCMSAPIFGAEGTLAAVLDVSSARAEVTEGLTRLIAQGVAEAARRIEADLFRAAHPRDRILIVPGVEGALLACDGDELVTGATRAARNHLRLTGLGQPVADLLGLTDHDLVGAERATLRRALARHRGNASATARALGISRATFHRKLSHA